jgi:hypothetical protein
MLIDMKRTRLVKIGDRRIPIIEKELAEVPCNDVSDALAKHGAVVIQDPRFASEKKRLEKQGKKAMEKLGWI